MPLSVRDPKIMSLVENVCLSNRDGAPFELGSGADSEGDWR